MQPNLEIAYITLFGLQKGHNTIGKIIRLCRRCIAERERFTNAKVSVILKEPPMLFAFVRDLVTSFLDKKYGLCDRLHEGSSTLTLTSKGHATLDSLANEIGDTSLLEMYNTVVCMECRGEATKIYTPSNF